MDTDGRNRRKLVEHAREPFWSPDSRTIGYLPQEYPKFNVVDYYTKGMNFYDLGSGAFSRGPEGKGVSGKPGCFLADCALCCISPASAPRPNPVFYS